MTVSEYTKDTPLYNSRLVIHIRLIRERYNYVDVNQALVHAEIEHHQIADEGHWFT